LAVNGHVTFSNQSGCFPG